MGIDTTIVARYAGGITNVINDYLVPLIFTICVIVFLFGVAKAYIFSSGSETARAEGHKLILWGVIGFAVMVSIWGLVNIAIGVLGVGGAPVAPFVPKIPT